MHKLIILLGMGVTTLSFGQKTAINDYFIADSDTTFCSKLTYQLTAQSYLAGIEYVNEDGKAVSIQGRSKVPDVTTFYIDGKTIDRIPQKVNKPDGYVKFVRRVVDGKLKVHYYHNEMTSSSLNVSTGSMKTTTTGIIKFFIKMPDGTYYNINKSSHMRDYIVPYLKNCPEFVEAYKGDYSEAYDEFTKMIELYNSLCE